MKRNFWSLGFWNIGIINMSFEELLENPDGISISWMKHRYKDRFFADPFPIREDDNYYYILVEEFKYLKRKGTIELLTIKKQNMRLIEKKPVIETQYHLSFPFTKGKNIVPEQNKSGNLYLYNENGEESKVCDCPLIDSVFFEYKGQTYLFGTIIKDSKEDANTKLYLYKSVDGNFEPVYDKPIVDDITCARCAGKIIEYKGRLIRPTQDCKKIYGNSVNFQEIISLEPQFVEKHICSINSYKEKKYNLGLHTFNMISENKAVVDGFQYHFRPFLKILMRICRK